MKHSLSLAAVLIVVALSASTQLAHAGTRGAVEKARGDYPSFDISDKRPATPAQPGYAAQYAPYDYSYPAARSYSYAPSSGKPAAASTQIIPEANRSAVSKARGN